MLKIRWSCDRLIFNMEIPIPGKDGLYIETGPWMKLIALGTIKISHTGQLFYLRSSPPDSMLSTTDKALSIKKEFRASSSGWLDI